MLNIEERLNSKEKLKSWIAQDRVSCGFSAQRSVKEFFVELFAPNYILKFLRLLRRCEYLSNCTTLLNRMFFVYNRLKLRKLQLKLGFTIPMNVFGPGLSMAHYGTIVVSPYASVGRNCRLHVGVNIGATGGTNLAPVIGDNCYIGPGAILFGNISIADNVSIGANATVNKSFSEANVVLAGTPAVIVKRDSKSWNSKKQSIV